MRIGIITAKGTYQKSIQLHLWGNVISFSFSLWVSPLCPRLPETAPASEGVGPTKFKTTLLAYLQEYKLPILNEFISYVKRADFSAVK